MINLNKQDYLNEIEDECREYIEENLDYYTNFAQLYEDMQMTVTGNDCGSYYCNTLKAEKALEGVIWDDEVNDLCKGLGYENGIPMDQGAEAADVIVRYVLMDQLYSNLEEYFNDLKEDYEEDIDD